MQLCWEGGRGVPILAVYGLATTEHLPGVQEPSLLCGIFIQVPQGDVGCVARLEDGWTTVSWPDHSQVSLTIVRRHAVITRGQVKPSASIQGPGPDRTREPETRTSKMGPGARITRCRRQTRPPAAAKRPWGPSGCGGWVGRPCVSRLALQLSGDFRAATTQMGCQDVTEDMVKCTFTGPVIRLFFRPRRQAVVLHQKPWQVPLRTQPAETGSGV